MHCNAVQPTDSAEEPKIYVGVVLSMSQIKTYSTNKIFSIQILRAIAVSIVLLYHAQAFSYYQSIKFINIFFMSFGWTGVDLFFVISGFVICYTSYDLIGDETNYLIFLKKRFARIYPNYWCVLIYILSLEYLVNIKLSNAPTTLLINNILLIPPFQTFIIDAAWTLTFEVCFYLIFASVIVFLNKKLFLTFLILWISLIVFTFLSNRPISLPFSLILSPINIEFISGCVIALLYKRNIQIMPKTILAAGVILFTMLILYQELYISNSAFHDDHNRIMQRSVSLSVVFSAIIYGFIYIEINTKKTLNKILLLIGDASYSFYLLHMIILKYISYCYLFTCGYMNLNILSNAPLSFYLFFLYSIPALLSILHYKYVEKYLLIKFRKILYL